MWFRSVTAALIFAAVQILGGGVASAQKYPTKPVRLIVPFGAGGTLWHVATLLGQKLGEKWGQQVVVEPRPGGSGNIGAELVSRSAPDGYSLMVTPQAIAINVAFLTTPVNPLTALDPIAMIAMGESFLVVPQSLPVKNVQEFVAHAKANPTKLNYVSLGTGTMSMVSAQLFNSIAGIQAEAIPYTGVPTATADLMTGRISYWITTLSNIPEGSTLRLLAVTGSHRAAQAPDVPTFTEAGYPTFKATVWYGLFGPPGMPKDLLARINADVAEVLKSADFTKFFTTVMMDPGQGNLEEVRQFVKDEVERWTAVAKANGGAAK